MKKSTNGRGKKFIGGGAALTALAAAGIGAARRLPPQYKIGEAMLQETTELPGNYVLIKFSDGAQVVLVNDGDVKHYLDGSERGERMRYLIDRRAKAINGQLPGMLLIG